jgi:hypothetical protein
LASGEPGEVACDDSGYEGEHHIGATTDVFVACERAAEPGTSVDSFFGMIDALRLESPPGQVGEILELLWRARPGRTRSGRGCSTTRRRSLRSTR